MYNFKVQPISLILFVVLEVFIVFVYKRYLYQSDFLNGLGLVNGIESSIYLCFDCDCN